MRILQILLPLLLTFSCRLPDNFGFYQPITMTMEVPDGPPEFKAGWYDGCRNGLGVKNFVNSYVYQEGKGPNFGTGVYHHTPGYQSGWGGGWYACYAYTQRFVGFNSMRHFPLE
jgi:hypothetical protein